MRLGINEGIFPAAWTPLEKIHACSETGFRCIEFNVDPRHLLPRRLNGARRREIAAKAEDLGVEIASISLNALWVFSLSSSDPRVREIAVDLIKETVDLAIEWNAKCVLIPGCQSGEMPQEEALKFFIAGVSSVVPMADRAHVRLALELVTTGLFPNYAVVRDVVDLVGGSSTGAYFDVGNVSRLGLEVEPELQSVADRVVQVHVKDTATTFFGDGQVDFDLFVESLKQVEYDGPLVVELGPDVTDPYKIARESYRHLTNLLIGHRVNIE